MNVRTYIYVNLTCGVSILLTGKRIFGDGIIILLLVAIQRIHYSFSRTTPTTDLPFGTDVTAYISR